MNASNRLSLNPLYWNNSFKVPHGSCDPYSTLIVHVNRFLNYSPNSYTRLSDASTSSNRLKIHFLDVRKVGLLLFRLKFLPVEWLFLVWKLKIVVPDQIWRIQRMGQRMVLFLRINFPKKAWYFGSHLMKTLRS